MWYTYMIIFAYPWRAPAQNTSDVYIFSKLTAPWENVILRVVGYLIWTDLRWEEKKSTPRALLKTTVTIGSISTALRLWSQLGQESLAGNFKGNPGALASLIGTLKSSNIFSGYLLWLHDMQYYTHVQERSKKGNHSLILRHCVSRNERLSSVIIRPRFEHVMAQTFLDKSEWYTDKALKKSLDTSYWSLNYMDSCFNP